MTGELLICGGEVADGDSPPRRADVAIDDGRISAIEPLLAPDGFARVVRADGLLLCPGFVDMHAHSALRPFSDPLQAPKIAQGFTTEVLHPDGLSPAPVLPHRRDDRRNYLRALEGPGPQEWPWSTLPEYLDALAGTQPTTSLVPSVGHGAVRDFVIGSENRAPDHDELRTMRATIRAAFQAGARVLSFGMIYLPAVYATTEELEAVAQEAAAAGAPLVPHVRNEGAGILTAIDEFVGICRRTGASLHLSHLKLIGNEHLLERLLQLLERAAAEIDMTFDQYPYGAGSTLLTALLPPWALEGGSARVLSRLADRATRRRIIHDVEHGIAGWENIYATCSPEQITISHAADVRIDAVGQTLAQLCDAAHDHPLAAAMNLLQDTQLDAAMVDHYATEATVRTLFNRAGATVGSDGIFGAHPHPRLYGTAARVLGRYALRERLVTVQEAVARLTSRAADRLRLADRGRIRPGLRADLVLLNPDRYLDLATYDDPRRYPDGVVAVYVQGTPVWADGHPTGDRPGGVVRVPLAGL